VEYFIRIHGTRHVTCAFGEVDWSGIHKGGNLLAPRHRVYRYQEKNQEDSNGMAAHALPKGRDKGRHHHFLFGD
jgi:hypothetical protein